MGIITLIECDCGNKFEPEEETVLGHETDYPQTPITLEICPECNKEWKYWTNGSFITEKD